MKEVKYKLIVHVPLTHADTVRDALGSVGAGKIGNYDSCSFSYKGVGRFRGNENSNPAVGNKGVLEEVEEEVIEVVMQEAILKVAIEKLKEVHPYEEPAYEVIKLENF